MNAVMNLKVLLPFLKISAQLSEWRLLKQDLASQSSAYAEKQKLF
jgi:hypothetical protein